MGSKRNTGKKRRALEKAGEHRKKKELWYNTKKAGSSPGKAGEMGENTGKRWRNTRKKWRALYSNSFSNETGNSLLDVREINRKFIVVEKSGEPSIEIYE